MDVVLVYSCHTDFEKLEIARVAPLVLSKDTTDFPTKMVEC
jgi:hypothetical protein